MARKSGTPSPSPPPAVRASAPGWRDPRLWVGVALVAASVVVGARLLASADDTVRVWGIATEMGAGDQVDESDLVARRVRFADAADLERYYTVADELPADLELTRGVGAGELLPRAAVGSAGEVDTVQVPIAVDAEQVPGSVGSGSVVDVYLVGPGSGLGKGSGPALTGVTVLDAPRLEETFGSTGKRQLVLAVPDEDAPPFFALLSRSDAPVVTVVRRG